MKVSDFKLALADLDQLTFLDAEAAPIPAHFHITEAGLSSKHFIDCGGTIREERAISLQLWIADDFQHRLSPQKLAGILDKAEPLWAGQDLDIEIEYQQNTLGRYALRFDGKYFILKPKQADCLAKDKCGIPTEKPKIRLSELKTCCPPNSGCC